MMYIRGSTVAGKAATCADPAQDTNGDHIVDLAETGPALIPLNGNPVTLQIATNTYPKAAADDEFAIQTVSIKALQVVLKKQFGIADLRFTDRMIYMHGVPGRTSLPSTVKSFPGVPATLTLPGARSVIRDIW